MHRSMPTGTSGWQVGWQGQQTDRDLLRAAPWPVPPFVFMFLGVEPACCAGIFVLNFDCSLSVCSVPRDDTFADRGAGRGACYPHRRTVVWSALSHRSILSLCSVTQYTSAIVAHFIPPCGSLLRHFASRPIETVFLAPRHTSYQNRCGISPLSNPVPSCYTGNTTTYAHLKSCRVTW